MHPAQEVKARELMNQLQNIHQRQWLYQRGELVDGGFQQCWRCGVLMPPDEATEFAITSIAAHACFTRAGALSCPEKVAKLRRAQDALQTVRKRNSNGLQTLADAQL